MDRGVLDRAGLTPLERNVLVMSHRHRGRLEYCTGLITKARTTEAEKIRMLEEARATARDKIARAVAQGPPPAPAEKPRTFRPSQYSTLEEEEVPVAKPRPGSRVEQILELMKAQEEPLSAKEVAERLGERADLVGASMAEMAGRRPPLLDRVVYRPNPGGRPTPLFLTRERAEAAGLPPLSGPPRPPVESRPPAVQAPAPPEPESVASTAADARSNGAGAPIAGPAPPPDYTRKPVTASSTVTAFLYLLMRDHLPTGKVKSLLDDVAAAHLNGPPNFTSPELEALAKRYAAALEEGRIIVGV